MNPAAHVELPQEPTSENTHKYIMIPGTVDFYISGDGWLKQSKDDPIFVNPRMSNGELMQNSLDRSHHIHLPTTGILNSGKWDGSKEEFTWGWHEANSLQPLDKKVWWRPGCAALLV